MDWDRKRPSDRDTANFAILDQLRGRIKKSAKIWGILFENRLDKTWSLPVYLRRASTLLFLLCFFSYGVWLESLLRKAGERRFVRKATFVFGFGVSPNKNLTLRKGGNNE